MFNVGVENWSKYRKRFISIVDQTDTGNKVKVLFDVRKDKEVYTRESKRKTRQTDGKNIVDGWKLSNGKNNVENKNKDVKVSGILMYADVLKNKKYEEKIKSIPFGLI